MHVLGIHQTSALGRLHTVHHCDSLDNYQLSPDERHGEIFALGSEVVILHTITLWDSFTEGQQLPAIKPWAFRQGVLGQLTNQHKWIMKWRTLCDTGSKTNQMTCRGGSRGAKWNEDKRGQPCWDKDTVHTQKLDIFLFISCWIPAMKMDDAHQWHT